MKYLIENGKIQLEKIIKNKNKIIAKCNNTIDEVSTEKLIRL